jgi:two-component system NarL family response regulator
MLRRLQQGEAPISGKLAARILDEFRQLGRNKSALPETTETLTERETEILELVAQGATNREIASALCITENTAKIHLRNILEKLHLDNRIQAAVYAVRLELAKGQLAEG